MGEEEDGHCCVLAVVAGPEDSSVGHVSAGDITVVAGLTALGVGHDSDDVNYQPVMIQRMTQLLAMNLLLPWLISPLVHLPKIPLM